MIKKNTHIKSDGVNYNVSVQSFSPIQKSNSGQSNAIDPFNNYYRHHEIIPPPLNPLVLAKMSENSDVLGPLYDAMATNVDGFGYELPELEQWKGKTKDLKEAQDEKNKLRLFLDHINYQQNITQLKTDLRKDYESMGYCYIEIVDNRGGEIAEAHRLTAHTVRLTVQDEEYTEFDQKARDSHGNIVQIQRSVRFRRYVQIVKTKKVYFKEFNDPRDISAKTGKPVSRSSSRLATKVIMMKQTCSYSLYGMPRWVGSLISILGSRKAEEVNYLYFDNKAIPPVIITVSGGALAPEAIKQLEHLYEREIKGVQNFHKALVLQAEPMDTGKSGALPGEELSPVKIEVKPMTEFMQQDALFSNYCKESSRKTIGTFRIPPMFLGRSDDYTRATALESTRVGEQQIFQPERNKFDYIMNHQLLTEMGIKYFAYKALGAKMTDDAGILKAMTGVKDVIPIRTILEQVAATRNVPLGDDIPKEWNKLTLQDIKNQGLKFKFEGKEVDGKNVDLNKSEDFINGIIDIRKQVLEKLNKKTVKMEM